MLQMNDPPVSACSMSSTLNDESCILRERLLETLQRSNGHDPTKQSIRALYVPQRLERSKAESALLLRHGHELLACFAEGNEVKPTKIVPRLVLVRKSDCLEGYLFRVATLCMLSKAVGYWSAKIRSTRSKRVILH